MLAPSIQVGEIRIWRGTFGSPCSCCISCVATRSTTASPISPMPATFDTVLSEADFFDVITYLRSS